MSGKSSILLRGNLTGRMAEELLGIVKEDPTFVPNMEPKGFFGLQIMRDLTKVLEDCFEVKFIRRVISCSKE
jgi:hypothetical protein